MPSEKAPEWTVNTQREVADFFGVDPSTVSLWIKQGCPGTRRKYNLSEIAQWCRGNVWVPKQNGDDIWFTGDEPAELKEQYLREQIRNKKINTRLKEFEVQQKEDQLVDRDVITEKLGRCAALIRGAADRIQRDYGEGPFELIDEALVEFLGIVSDSIGGETADDFAASDL